MRGLYNRWIPVVPTLKQMQFLLLPEQEAFYGGAAGGGKSEALLMGAAMFVHVKDYHAIIFRKELQTLKLEGGLIPRSKEWWAGRARWNGDTYTWAFPSGATVSFGYLNYEDDYVRYGSTEYQYIAFDELPEIRESDFRFMFSRLRRTRKQEELDIPLRVRSAGNPVGPGVVWVKRRYNLPLGTYERPFIPARLEDNPHLDREAYERSLNVLDPVTRARLRDGDWSIRDIGSMFRRSWFQLVRELPAGCRAVRYWDLAATAPAPGKDPSWTAGALVAEKSGVYYIVDIVRTRGTPRQIEKLVAQTAVLDAARQDLAHVNIYMEQEPGSSGVNTIDHYARNVLRGYSFRGHKTTGSKENRAAPVSSAAEAGNVKLVVGPWIDAWLDEAEAFPEGRHKDQVDAVSGAFNMLNKRRRPVKYRSRVF